MHMRVQEMCIRCDGWSKVRAECIGLGEACKVFLMDGRGDGSRRGRWYDRSRSRSGIDWLRRDDRGIFKVHMIGGRCLVDHGLGFVSGFSGHIRGLLHAVDLDWVG